jgi:hypothetical protein
MTGHLQWRRTPGLPWRVTLRGVVVASADDVVLLAGPAAAIWDALDEPAGEDALPAAVAEVCGDVDPEAVTSAFRLLREQGLVVSA